MTEPQALSIEQLQQMIRREQKRRVRACAADIQAALEKYGCELVAEPTIDDGRIKAAVAIKAKR